MNGATRNEGLECLRNPGRISDTAQSSLKQWSDGGNAKMATQVLAGVFQASLGGGSALGAAAGVASNEGFLTKLSAIINKGVDGDGIAHEGAMNLASIGLGLIAGGLVGDATSGAIAANTSQQYGYYDYRDGKRQLLASDALREMAGGDEALLQGMRTLINEAIKNGADPASLAAALTTPGVANNMAGMALVEASAQREYGTSFGALGLEDQKILLGMVGKVYVEGVQSIGPDGQPLAAVGSVEKLPTVEVVGKSSGGLLHAGQLVSGVIESGGRGVEKASNWLGQDTALALAYVAMAAAGGPVKTVASTLFENSAPGEFLLNKKQQYLVDPFGNFLGTYGLGAQNEQQLQSVRPATNMMAGMGVDSMASVIGVISTGKAANSLLESSQGIGKKIDDAEGKIVWVDEKASMSSKARDYNDSAPGARSNVETQASQAPSITRTMPDGTERPVKFDGVDADVLVDRKISVVTTPKAKDQALRQSQALSEQGLTGRWEVPTQAQANRAKKMFEELGIKNITVEVVKP
ncbi:hypothetical protein [Xanthomonas citri]|uniref:hypothetical protein n=1 Tax=Xanthomonas citri TaxID=346 RepID=UPI001C919566|nr:hypothetical protein [Xanthomonas citri]